MKRVLFAAVLLAAPGLASAQVPSVYCENGVPIDGTIPLNVLYGAFDRAAQVYGAVHLVQDLLLPQLQKGPSSFAFAYDTAGVLGAIDVPTCVGKSVRGDLASGGMGFGYRWGPVSLYYAGATTWLSFFEATTYSRVIGSNGFPILGSLASPIAVFVPRVDFDEFSVSVDFIAGGGLHLKFVDVLAGFVASRGLYAAIFQGNSRLFAGGAFSDQLERLPYLHFGVDSLDWLLGESVVSVIGSTKVFAERVEYTALPEASVAREDYGEAPAVLFDYWTVHWNQTRIAEGLLDLRAALVVKPKVQLFDGTLSVRVYCLDDDEKCEAPVMLTGGVMYKPTTWFYGTDGGYLPRAELSLGPRGLGITMGLNDPSVVTVFPFAYNAMFVRVTISAGGPTEDPAEEVPEPLSDSEMPAMPAAVPPPVEAPAIELPPAVPPPVEPAPVEPPSTVPTPEPSSPEATPPEPSEVPPS